MVGEGLQIICRNTCNGTEFSLLASKKFISQGYFHFTMRISLLVFVLIVLILVPFLIWGGQLEAIFSLEGSKVWMEQYGHWAWAVGLLLLLADLFLPLPATVIISALGILYGPWLGGLIGATGVTLAGSLAYHLSAALGERGAVWLLGEKDFERGQDLFLHHGGWMVAFSRWLPILPEVIAVMAGLSRMPAKIFYVGILCGSIPLGFAYAWIGHLGRDVPQFAILLSAGLPVLLWFVFGRKFRSQESNNK